MCVPCVYLGFQSADFKHYSEEFGLLEERLGSESFPDSEVKVIKDQMSQLETAIQASQYLYTPRRNGYLKAHTFVWIAGGRAHSLFVDDKGSVWACGDNTHGQLGCSLDVSVGTHVICLSVLRGLIGRVIVITTRILL